MEIWGLGLGAALALWRYFFDVDWVLRVKLRKRRKRNSRAWKLADPIDLSGAGRGWLL